MGGAVRWVGSGPADGGARCGWLLEAPLGLVAFSAGLMLARGIFCVRGVALDGGFSGGH